MQKQIVNKIRRQPLTPHITPIKIKNLQELLFKKRSFEKERSLAEIVAGESRLKILYLLSQEDQLSVGDIADILKSKPSGISHQLAILRKHQLVRAKKKQKIVFYSLKTPLPKLVWAAVDLR